MAFSSWLHRVEETSSARVEVLDIPLSHRSPRQDDFAKRPILDQMAQGFARLAEGIDPLDDRLDGPADDQREDVPPRGGDRDRRLGEQREADHPRALPDQVRYIDRGFASCGVAQRDQDTAETKAAQRLTGHGPADALDNDIDALAGRYPANALGEAFYG